MVLFERCNYRRKQKYFSLILEQKFVLQYVVVYFQSTQLYCATWHSTGWMIDLFVKHASGSSVSWSKTYLGSAAL